MYFLKENIKIYSMVRNNQDKPENKLIYKNFILRKNCSVYTLSDFFIELFLT